MDNTTAAPQIGVATTVVNGPVSIENASGQVRSVSQGDPIYLNDIIQTPAKGYIKITLEDGTLFQLGPLSRAQLEQYSYRSEEEGGHFESNVFVGFFRFISGKLSGENEGQQHTVIKTPSATIGIRGSEIDGQVDFDGSTTILHSAGLIDITPLFSQESFSIYQSGTRIFIDNNSVERGLASPLFIEQFRDHLDTLGRYEASDSVLLVPPPALDMHGRGANGQPPPHLQDLTHLPPPLVEKLRAGEVLPFTRQPPSPASTSDQGEFRPDLLARKLPEQTSSDNPSVAMQAPHPFDKLADIPEDRLVLLQKLRQGDAPFSEPLDKVLTRLESTVKDDHARERERKHQEDNRVDEPNEHTKNLLVFHDAPPLEGNLLNRAPVAVGDNRTLGAGLALVMNDLLANDFDPDGDMLRIVSVTGASSGSVTLGENNSVMFTRADAQIGSFTESFTYTITDGKGRFAEAEVVINGEPLRDLALQLQDDFFSLSSGQTLQIGVQDLLQNDLSAGLTVISVDNARDGVVSLNADASVSFNPNLGFLGDAGFSYTVQDSLGNTATANVTVNIAALSNSSPVAVDDQFATLQNSALTITASTLLANDSDANGAQTLTLSNVSNGIGGTVSLQAGVVQFVPNPDFIGTANFSYSIVDELGATDSATVTVDVIAVNTVTVQAQPDSASTSKNTPLTLDSVSLLSNDIDPTGQGLTLLSVTNGSGGTVSLQGNVVEFVPDTDFIGTANFSYTVQDSQGTQSSAAVSVDVIAVNTVTVQAQPDSASTSKNTPLTLDSVSLLSNDIDPTGQGLTLLSVTNGNGGTVSLQGNVVEFVPDTDFIGTANFSYTVQDSQGMQSSAAVSVDVVNQAPIAQADTATTTINQAVSIPLTTLLSNDSDPDINDNVVFESLGASSNGTVSLSDQGDAVIFTPTTDFTGVAEFSYSIQDSSGATSTALVTVDVLPSTDNIQAVADNFTSSVNQTFTVDSATLLANDRFSDPDLQAAATISSVGNAVNGQVRFDSSTQQMSFVPAAGFSGAASFDYTLTANGLSSTGTVNLTITAPPLTAVDDSGFFTRGGETLSIDVNRLLANDQNPSGTPLNLSSVNNSQGGIAQLSALGTVDFTADPNYLGIASFDYQITNGSETSQATVLIDVQASNQAPTAVDDQFDIPFYQTVTLSTLDLLANDTDPNPTDLLSFVGVQNVPTGLTVTRSGDSLQIFADYQNLADLSSTQFQYVITDGSQEATGTVNLNADNVLLGTTGADSLRPSLDTLEIISGLEGDDTLGAPNEQDILLGDAGNDLFLLQLDTAAGAMLDGGADTDTLSLTGDGQILNLIQNNSLSPDQALNLSGIDEIDLSAGSNNQLIIGLDDVLSISDNGLLLVEGNRSSVVSSVGAGWVSGEQVSIDGALYNSYTASGAELLVSTEVILQFIS